MSNIFNAILNGNTTFLENYINDTFEFIEPLNDKIDGKERDIYMTFLIGTLMHMLETYEMNQNMEEGDEYPYIEIVPKIKRSLFSPIIFMIAVKKEDESLINASKRAINEINKKKIFQKMIQDGFDPCKILLYGLGCFKKDCAVRNETADKFIKEK